MCVYIYICNIITLYFGVQDVRLHYVSAGSEDKPLMLLVHGFPEFWYSWRHQLREFKDSYRLVPVLQIFTHVLGVALIAKVCINI